MRLDGWRVFVLLAILLAAVRVLPLIAEPRTAVMQRSDERTYVILTTNLLAGRGLSLATEPPFTPSTVRTPGYPLFLAALHEVGIRSVQQATIAQGLLDAMTGILLALVARGLAGALAGPVALVAWTLLGPGAGVVRDLYTEVLAMALAALALALVIGGLRRDGRAWLLVAAGFSLGALTLTRPAQVIWIPLAIVIVAAETRKARPALALMAGAAAPLLAWLARNILVAGKPILLATLSSGMNFWLGTVSDGRSPTAWIDDGTPQGRFEMQLELADTPEEMRRVQAAWNAYMPALLDGVDPAAGEAADRDLRALGVERWRRDPIRCARLRAVNVARLIDQPERRFGVAASIVAWLGGLGFGFALWRRGRVSALLLAAPLLLLLAHVPLYSEPRYLYPAYPMLVLALAVGLTGTLARRAGRPAEPGPENASAM